METAAINPAPSPASNQSNQSNHNPAIRNIVNLFESVLKQNGFKGEFLVDKASRVINATDNSIYEVLPAAIAQPFDGADLELLIKLANREPFDGLFFTARGGGTGTNGQSLSNGVVLDFSRYMTRILDFNPAELTITVEPGVILSDLNRMLAPHGLFFAPNVSTADRATIGGMIATDAAGKGSLIYGKTADHVLGLKLLLADGRQLDTISREGAAATTGLYASVASQLGSWLAPLQVEINARFPRLKRPLSGYNLQQCWQDGEFSLERLISGSEGTLGLVTAAKLKLLPIPKHKALLVVHYPSFLAALEDAQFLIHFAPLAIEAVDEKVQKSAQGLPNWPTLANLLNSVDKNYISNFMEFVADSREAFEAKLAEVEAALQQRAANYVLVRDNAQINQLWSIRSLAVGLVGKLPGVRKPVAFVEDALVPPENLASLVAELQSALDARELQYAMYGHVDVGCIHVRPALNMQDPADRAQIRPLTELVIQLVTKYKGILWGEHGKGYRGEFVPEVFGPVLYPILCQIKQLFDPLNRLNPGKLTAPEANTQLTRIELVPMRGELDQVIPQVNQQDFAGAMLCNGNAACFNQDPANVMCPSYKITKNRIHSPKGRAMLVKEWLREQALPNGRALAAADDAFAALSACLGCKACAGKCPTQVSIPDLRTRFLERYHRLYRKRKLREVLIGQIESLLPLAAKFPKMWNFIHRHRLAPRLGLSHVPLFKTDLSLPTGLAQLSVALYTDPTQAASLAERAVVVFADVFTGFLDNQVLFASIKLLQGLGYVPYVIYPRASGKSLIVGGFIAEFQKNSQKLASSLNPLLQTGVPVLALENTITTMFRDEMNKFATPLAGSVQTLAEFLLPSCGQLAELKSSAASVQTQPAPTQTQANVAPAQKYRLLPHCTEQALMPAESSNWQKIYAACGLSLEVKNLGCCGMAGTYGHLQEYQASSEGLFQLNWQPQLQDKPVTDHQITLLASGFSCRAQSAHLAKQVLPHPVEVLAQLLVD